MTPRIENAGRALADRQGATAIEYAVVAGGMAAALVAAYSGFFTRVGALLAPVAFP